ncbi:MAG: hypothetical protein EBV45_01155 [Chloroflexi bacterium]|nr:hypothetical protein [Chloroflexota bacterium]
MDKLVVIDDSLVMQLLHNGAAVAQFPCLLNKLEVFKTAAVSSCGACAQKRHDRQRTEMARLKTCLAGMSAEKKAQLKQLLNAERVRIVYTNLAGQVVQLTF